MLLSLMMLKLIPVNTYWFTTYARILIYYVLYAVRQRYIKVGTLCKKNPLIRDNDDKTNFNFPCVYMTVTEYIYEAKAVQ